MNLTQFVAHYGLIGFSLSTALGLAFSDVIKNISEEVFMPLLGIIFNIKNLSEYTVRIMNQDISVGLVITSILSYFFTISIIIFFGYYVFYEFTKNIRELTISRQREISEHQKKTGEVLEKIHNLQKEMDRRIFGVPGTAYV